MLAWAFATDEAVSLQGLQGLRQHLLADAVGAPSEGAPALLTDIRTLLKQAS